MPYFVRPFRNMRPVRSQPGTKNPGSILKSRTTGIGCALHPDVFDAYNATQIMEGRLTTPIAQLMQYINEKFNIPSNFTPRTQAFDTTWFTPEMEDAFEAAQMKRSRSHPHPLLDHCGNFDTWAGHFYLNLEESGYLQIMPKSPEEATTLEDILMFNGLPWPAYSVLYDAVLNDKERNDQNFEYGSLKLLVVNDLVMLGLGHIEIASEESLNRSKRVGRRPNIFVPNAWGRRFVAIARELRDPDLEIPEDAREAARNMYQRDYLRKAKEAQKQEMINRLGPEKAAYYENLGWL